MICIVLMLIVSLIYSHINYHTEMESRIINSFEWIRSQNSSNNENNSNYGFYEVIKIAVLSWIRKICIVLSVALYGSGLYEKPKLKIYIHNSTEGYSVIPLLAGVLNGGLWFNYGVITNNPFTLVASTICYTLNCLYVVVYHAFTEDKSLVVSGVRLILTIIIFTIIYTWLLPRNEGRRRAGELANAVSILLTSSPLVHLKEVYETSSNRTMPLFMISIGFTSSVLYIIYGWLIDDHYIMRPNRISGFVTGFQLIVYYLYSN